MTKYKEININPDGTQTTKTGDGKFANVFKVGDQVKTQVNRPIDADSTPPKQQKLGDSLPVQLPAPSIQEAQAAAESQYNDNNNNNLLSDYDDPMSGGDKATANAHANTEGHHSVLQKGSYTGTLQEGDIWTKKKMQTTDYTSVRKFERVFKWVHEYQNSQSGASAAYTMTPNSVTSNYNSGTYPNNEIQKDYIVANCINPYMKWFMDDMANWYTHFYKFGRIQKLHYEIVFENRLIDPHTYINQSARYSGGSLATITTNTTRSDSELAWRFGPWDVHTSTYTTAGGFPLATDEATWIREQMQSINAPMSNKFMIWRDINGNLVNPNSNRPYGAQWYDNQSYPGGGITGVTVGELKDPSAHINRRQVEHFDSGVKIGNSIEFSRTLHIDGPFAYTGAKLREIITSNAQMSNFIKLLEINPTPPLNMTSIPEFFHFYFVPMGEYPMYQMKNAGVTAQDFLINRWMLPFETVAHITTTCDYCFFQRIGLDTAINPGSFPLPRTIQMAQSDLEIMRKWDEYNRDHVGVDIGSKYLVTPSYYLPVKELVEPLIPVDQLGHMYIDTTTEH